jgi:hypothetical protein
MISSRLTPKNTFWHLIRWNLLAPISVIILVILIWCFYFTYQDDIALRQRIIYVEVVNRHRKMERIETKQNLNVMVEKYSKKANNNSLFDKQWYSKRYF